MKHKEEILQWLNQILVETDSSRKALLVKSFQDKIWQDEEIKGNALNELLSELAYDLDFYEPNEAWRKESPGYFGNERLGELIKAGISKIKNS